MTTDSVAINVQAAQKLGVIHNLLEGANYSGKELEILMVRILFCLFAEDTGIFPQDAFKRYLEHRNSDSNPKPLTKLFQILNTPKENRASTLDPELQVLPYVNRGLFSEKLEIADFTKEMRASILDATHLDWSEISPDIFGSIFQSIKDREHRRQEGQHYTSERNIRKCLEPLFLNDLEEEFQSTTKLREFQKKLGKIKILDPACGSGNFLIVAYRELRRLEHKVLLKLQELGLDTAGLIQVEVDNFYGIELDEWAAQIAQVSLCLVEHQMNREVSESLGEHYVRLPLSDNQTIVTGNALELDWNEVVDVTQLTYIVGNPPFVGYTYHTTQQRKEIGAIFKQITKKAGMLDYVCCWFVKSLEMMKSNTEIRTALVSTNSITQGELVEPLWGYMLKEGVKIQFAHRTFLWGSEAKGKAVVCCVIIGFGMNSVEKPIIYDYKNIKSLNPVPRIVKNINPYLIDAPNSLIKSQSTPLSKVLPCLFGNKPTDNGFLSKISRDERDEWLIEEPFMEPYIKKMIGGYEFLNNKERYCLWLKDADPSIWNKSRIALERIQKVREFRINAGSESVRLATVPHLFRPIEYLNYCKYDTYIAIPQISSENRKYIPIGFINKSVICNNRIYMIPNAGLYEFGILTSLMHNSWMRVVGGRFGNGYSYLINIVYNTFIWPEVTKEQKEPIKLLAQSILDVRNKYPNSTLATLYNRNTMPADLVKAHDKLDKAVDKLYRKKPFEYENVKSINPTNIVPKDTSKSLSNVLPCLLGNSPFDNGQLSKISREERDEWIEKEPFMKPYIRKLIGGYEFLNNKERYCLWLKDVDPSIWSKSKIALERIQKVRESRLASKAKSTREYAEYPYLFRQVANTKNLDYITIPRVSSGNRKYIPIGFIDKSVICNDAIFMVPGGGLYEFGILTSLMHNSWMRIVCGRLGNGYRYSRNLVYNPFIWPEIIEDQKQTIESLAQSILDVRAKYPDSSLVTLYNPNTMPADLVKDHDKMDKAVDRLYREKPFESEMERVSLLFELYEKVTT